MYRPGKTDWPVSQRSDAVDLNDSPEQAKYRAKVRAWLVEHKDEAPVGPFAGEASEVARVVNAPLWRLLRKAVPSPLPPGFRSRRRSRAHRPG